MQKGARVPAGGLCEVSGHSDRPHRMWLKVRGEMWKEFRLWEQRGEMWKEFRLWEQSCNEKGPGNPESSEGCVLGRTGHPAWLGCGAWKEGTGEELGMVVGDSLQMCSLHLSVFFKAWKSHWRATMAENNGNICILKIILIEIEVLRLKLLLLSHFSCVWLCATPQTAAHQAPPSLGFSRQEHWSGLPLPSPMHEREKWKWSHSVVSDS